MMVWITRGGRQWCRVQRWRAPLALSSYRDAGPLRRWCARHGVVTSVRGYRRVEIALSSRVIIFTSGKRRRLCGGAGVWPVKRLVLVCGGIVTCLPLHCGACVVSLSLYVQLCGAFCICNMLCNMEVFQDVGGVGFAPHTLIHCHCQFSADGSFHPALSPVTFVSGVLPAAGLAYFDYILI